MSPSPRSKRPADPEPAGRQADIALVLFRRDLRLADQPALFAACRNHAGVVPVYIHAPEHENPWPPGAASRWWLHHSLSALDQRLAHQSARLHIAAGESLPTLRALIAASGARAVYSTRSCEPAEIVRDTTLMTALRADGIEVHSHPGNLWVEPWQLATAEGQPYRQFAAFWRRLRAQLPVEAPLPEARARRWLALADSLPLESLALCPRIPWDSGLAESWRPGEAGARQQLRQFVDDALGHYAGSRDLPARQSNSRLSAHLHFGEITPRQVLHVVRQNCSMQASAHHADSEPYLRELGWREFAHHLLYHFPETTDHCFDQRFAGFGWAADDPLALARWQQGRTGIPLVDAGMRELWHTGWMHNRVRMVTASFLTKNLRQHWLHGARWFWDTLVDADLANNTLGWQWVAGCGADAAPYFRVFNPYLQAARFDPDAAYLKRWLPELAALPPRTLLEPWRDPAALTARGYPAPMIDIATTRRAALDAWHALPRR